MKPPITVEVLINAPIEKIWECFTEPKHIKNWCNASDDWHAPNATNDLRVGGKFNTRMESKNGKQGFDFEGIYTVIEQYKEIGYSMDDGRKVKIEFIKQGDGYKVVETFDPEDENPIEMQRGGWQAILDNFKKYTSLL